MSIDRRCHKQYCLLRFTFKRKRALFRGSQRLPNLSEQCQLERCCRFARLAIGKRLIERCCSFARPAIIVSGRLRQRPPFHYQSKTVELVPDKHVVFPVRTS